MALGTLLHRLIGLVGGEPSGTGKAFSKERPLLADGRGALVCELQSSGMRWTISESLWQRLFLIFFM